MSLPTNGTPSQEPASPPEPSPAAPAPTPGVRVTWPVLYLLVALIVLALAISGLLWQRLADIQEILARQSADSGATAIEARTLARQAQELAQDASARQAVMESRLGEVTAQRSQLEELMQSLTRSRDENLVLDIEAALRLAQQQAQLTLSPEPLLAALRAADQRLSRATQPRLARVRGAIARDMDRIKAASVADVPALMVRMDELARLVDDLPVANAVGAAALASRPVRREPAPDQTAPWWERTLALVTQEARALLRVSRIDQPEAMLVSPDEAFFLRENLKLKLLNARLSLLSRQADLARADLAAVASSLGRYFDPAARRTQSAASMVQELQAQLRNVDLPRIDETLALLDATAAGR